MTAWLIQIHQWFAVQQHVPPHHRTPSPTLLIIIRGSNHSFLTLAAGKIIDELTVGAKFPPSHCAVRDTHYLTVQQITHARCHDHLMCMQGSLVCVVADWSCPIWPCCFKTNCTSYNHIKAPHTKNHILAKYFLLLLFFPLVFLVFFWWLTVSSIATPLFLYRHKLLQHQNAKVSS